MIHIAVISIVGSIVGCSRFCSSCSLIMALYGPLDLLSEATESNWPKEFQVKPRNLLGDLRINYWWHSWRLLWSCDLDPNDWYELLLYPNDLQLLQLLEHMPKIKSKKSNNFRRILGFFSIRKMSSFIKMCTKENTWSTNWSLYWMSFLAEKPSQPIHPRQW